MWKDPAELGVQPKGPGITYADPQLSRVKTSKDPVTPPPRYVVKNHFPNFHNFFLKFRLSQFSNFHNSYFFNSDQLESQQTTASPLERWQGKLCSSFLFILFSSQFSWVYSLHSSNQPSIQPIKFDFQGVGENLRLWRTMLWGWQILLQHLEGDPLLRMDFLILTFTPKLWEVFSLKSVLTQGMALFGQILILLFSAMQCLWLRLVKGDISGKVISIEFLSLSNDRFRTVVSTIRMISLPPNCYAVATGVAV